MSSRVVALFFITSTIGERMNHELLDYDPSPNPEAIVSSSDEFLRITVLTEKLIRVQSGPDFDDRPSLAVVHRNISPATPFKVARHSRGLIVRTESVELFYREGSRSLTAKSFQAENRITRQTYFYGQPPSGNLFGTIRTLDTLGPTYLNCSEISDPDAHCEFGLVSRDGWAIINDTNTARLEGKNDWWADSRGKSNNPSSSSIDIYLFMHGKDFKGALSDYSKIGGKVPLPPRYMFGVLWTRWYDFDSKNIKELIEEFERTDTPIDTLILDMNWHKKPWWGGYSFDERIIPDPQALMDFIKSRNLSVGLNIHDCLLAEKGCPSGTLSQDDELFFSAYASAVGANSDNNKAFFPLDLLNETRAIGKEDVVTKSFEKLSDMWWIDWQQGDTNVGGLRGGSQNPTIWLNKLRYTNRKRWGLNTRGSVLSRYGGLGSQRYGTGFSGDVEMLDWENLSYQPFFTSTAANVLFQWSHDITGPNRDPELLVRWTQWGAFSPVLRFHERGMSSGPCAYANFPYPGKDCATVNVWETLPGRFRQSVRESLELRAQLVPYMYTEAYKMYVSGVPWLRPLYYDFSDENDSFENPSQYMFGDLITVAPIVQRSSAESPSVTEWSIYVPRGLWYSPNDGFLIRGPNTFSRFWDLSEVPYLVKAGSVLPKRFVGKGSRLGTAMRNNTEIVFEIIPGGSQGNVSVYEDDGKTTDYVTKEESFGWIHASYEKRQNMEIFVKVWSDDSMVLPNRSVRIELLDSPPIVSFVCPDPEACRTEYDGEKLKATIVLEWGIEAHGKAVDISITCLEIKSDLSGIKGAIAHARLAKNALDEAVLTPGTHPCWHDMPCGFRPQDENLIRAAVVGELLNNENSAEHFDIKIKNFVSMYREAVSREVTVENILRTDSAWAPTQGGWTEQTRLRVNYAVETIKSALDNVCKTNPAVLCANITPRISQVFSVINE